MQSGRCEDATVPTEQNKCEPCGLTYSSSASKCACPGAANVQTSELDKMSQQICQECGFGWSSSTCYKCSVSTTSAFLGLTDEAKCQACGGSIVATKCSCGEGKTFGTTEKTCVNAVCQATSVSEFEGIQDEQVCKACGGALSNSKCSCGTGKGFDTASKTCKSTDSGCTSITKDNLESTNSETCKNCGLTYESSKCKCPSNLTTITVENVCKACSGTFNSTSSTCSGNALKVAFGILAMLFLI